MRAQARLWYVLLTIYISLLSVQPLTQSSCSTDLGMTFKSTNGYILFPDPSTKKQNRNIPGISLRGPGGVHCPWRIQLQPGQRINLTAWKFHQNSNKCYHNLRIEDGGATRDVSLCHGDIVRQKQLYTSRTNQISVYIVGRSQQLTDVVPFILQYSGI